MVPDHELEIPGYDLIRNDRNRQGGGVCLYVRKSLDYKPRTVTNESDIESIWIRLRQKKSYLNLAVMYRPPNSDSSYYDKILNEIECVKSSNEHVIIMGDLNYDCFSNPNPIKFIEMAYEMKQLVDAPTRVTLSSSTLLDVVISSCPNDHVSTQVMKVALSDHYLVHTKLRFAPAATRDCHHLVTYRDFKNFEEASFVSDLRKCDSITNVDFNPNNVLERWIRFKNDFTNLCDKHAPLRSRRLKPRFNPWIDKDIVRDMYQRDHMKSRAIRTKDPADANEYRRLRNHVTARINSAKKRYYDNELKINAGKPGKIWKLISRLTTSQNLSDTPDILPDEFNDYFVSVGQTVSDSLDNDVNTNDCWKGPKSNVLFKFDVVECSLVNKHLKQLNFNSSVDVLGFDSKLLRVAADVITPVLTKMFNVCITDGTVLDDWKCARVSPIYKGNGSKSDKCNYRPISVISHVAKIFEKVIQVQLMSFLIENNFISIDQSAYRKHHNTQTSLHRVVDDWLYNIGDNLFTGVCLLDIKKCFDSIDHKRLIFKLDCYGIRDVECQFFMSYLSNRKQAVKCNNILSNYKETSVGVPQGSVLGPILFLLFVNDLSQHIHLGNANLYADDCIVYCTGTSVSEVNSNLQKCIDDVSYWYSRNKLVLNTTKSSSMLITSKHKHQTTVDGNSLNISIADCEIVQVDHCEYLGVKIEQSLCWDLHINKLCGSLTRKVGMLSRMRKSTPRDIMIKIYMSSVQPCIDYAITVWGNTTNCNLDKIQRIQNFAARVVTNQFDYVNVRGLYIVKSLGWMNVRQRFYYFNVLLMFKCIHGLAPSYMSNDVLMECEMIPRPLRNSDSMDVYIPFISNSYQSKTFIATAGECWNELPRVLQDVCDINQFKMQVKKYIHGADFNDVTFTNA